MLQEIADQSWDPELRKTFSHMIDTNTYVDMTDSIKKLTGILERRDFTNGGRMDYYDR